ncbi:MAG: hypothetical protein ACLP7I_12195 [Limisphaerales bacterium]
MKKGKDEIAYDVAADVLGYSRRQTRRLIIRNGIKPIRYGYRTVKLPAEKILRLRLELVMKKRSHYQPTNGHRPTNGKGQR